MAGPLRPLVFSAALAAAVALCAMLTACERRPSGGAAAPTPAATPEPPRGEITGVVTLEGETDHSGVLVFLGGTKYSAYTDEAGHFAIGDLPPGVYRVTAQREGFVKKRLDDVTIETERAGLQQFQLLSAQLARQASIGEMVEKALGAISGVARYANRPDHAGIVAQIAHSQFSTVTDEHGGFAILNLEPGSYTLEFTAKGYETQTRPVVVRAGDVTYVPTSGTQEVVRLDPLALTQPTRRVKGALELYDLQGQRVDRYDETLVALEGTGYVALPDQQGRFVIENIAPGLYTIVALAPGFALPEKQPVNLIAVEEASVVLRLTQLPPEASDSGAARGVVMLDDGRPPTGVQVGFAGTSYVSLADQTGAFAISGVPAGSYTLVAVFEGYEQAELDGVVIAANAETDAGRLELKRIVKAPTVLVTEPFDGETDVPVRQAIPALIRFSEKMDPRSTLAAISVSPPAQFYFYLGRRHPLSDYDLAYLEFAGVGENAMQFGTTYRVTIDASAKDVFNVPMKEPYVFSFTTGRAQVIGSDPADGATDVVLSVGGRPVNIYFNAPVDAATLTADSIRVSPSEGQIPEVYSSTDPETGWTTAHVRLTWRRDTRYTITVESSVRLAGARARIDKLPYRFSFATAKGERVGERFSR